MGKTCLIINTNRTGYAVSQICDTMTVGELIETLQYFDEDMEVYFGNDYQGRNEWYTYGEITSEDLYTYEEEDDEDEEEYEDDEDEEE